MARYQQANALGGTPGALGDSPPRDEIIRFDAEQMKVGQYPADGRHGGDDGHAKRR